MCNIYSFSFINSIFVSSRLLTHSIPESRCVEVQNASRIFNPS